MGDLSRLVGNRIREARERHGLSQKELASAAGTTAVTLWSIEVGKTATNLDLLESIARQLGVEPWELLKPVAPPAPAQLDALDRELAALNPAGAPQSRTRSGKEKP